MSTATKAYPCTNRRVNCPQCATIFVLLLLLLPLHTTHNISYPNYATFRIIGHCRGGLSDTAIEVHSEAGQRAQVEGRSA